MRQSRADRKKANLAKGNKTADGKFKGHPLAPYLDGKMVDYYGDKRYTGEYPDVHVRFSMDARRAGDIITIKGHDLTSFYVELTEDEIKEWIDSRQEMARQTLEEAKKLGYGPEEPYFFTKPGEFVYDSAIRWDLGKDRYAVLRPSTSGSWDLESIANVKTYVANVFYDSDETYRDYHVRLPRHGVPRSEFYGQEYIQITDPYGHGARTIRETEQFVQEYNLLPERLDDLTATDVQAKYPDLFEGTSKVKGVPFYDPMTRDHYLAVKALYSLPVEVCVSLTGGQDMLRHIVDLEHIRAENDRHSSSLNHQLQPLGLNCTLEVDADKAYVTRHCFVNGPIPETPEGRQDLLGALQKAHDLVVDYDQTSHQLSTKLDLDDLVLLTDQSMYFQ